jgi:hypothetical protein
MMNPPFDASVEDIAQAAREGRPPRDHGPYGVRVGDDHLHYTPAVLADRVPLGAQILDAVDLRPARDYVLLQIMHDGATKEVRTEDPVDLRQPGLETFVAFKGDRLYRLTLNDRSLDWGARWITADVLLTLAQVDPAAFEVVLLHPQGQNRVLTGEDRADLGDPGVERFETIPLAIEIFVNTEPKVVHRRVLDFWQVVRLEYPQADPNQAQAAYTVTYAKGPKANPSGTLVKGQTVAVKQGMEFDVFVTDRS